MAGRRDRLAERSVGVAVGHWSGPSIVDAVHHLEAMTAGCADRSRRRASRLVPRPSAAQQTHAALRAVERPLVGRCEPAVGADEAATAGRRDGSLDRRQTQRELAGEDVAEDARRAAWRRSGRYRRGRPCRPSRRRRGRSCRRSTRPSGRPRRRRWRCTRGSPTCRPRRRAARRRRCRRRGRPHRSTRAPPAHAG